jgi:hypothetical protein
LTEIESLLARVWNPDTRPHADEARQCYNAGAIRASIAATWTAITADIIAKIGHLADDGETGAKAVNEDVLSAQKQGLTPAGIQAMQHIEASLLDKALELEIVDAVDKRALERIREDRNVCVHPSLRPFNETYLPLPEVARAHLAVALDVLLVHRPTQGRKIVESYFDFTCSPSFVPTVTHIQSAYFDRVRPATRRSLTIIAAKHAVLHLDPDDRMDALLYANRSASVLKAFAGRDRGLVRDIVVGLRDRFRHVTPHAQARALARLGDEDFFWDMTDGPLVDQFNSLIDLPGRGPDWQPDAAAFSHVAIESVRKRLPSLERQFAHFSPQQRARIIAARPHPYFVPAIIELLHRASNYRFGEQVGQLLISHAEFLTVDDLSKALAAWGDNDQARRAASMPEVAVSLLMATSHLGPARAAVFVAFLDRVRENTTDDDDDFYTYPALGAALSHIGLST